MVALALSGAVQPMNGDVWRSAVHRGA